MVTSVLIIVIAIAAPLLTPWDPYKTNVAARLQPPSLEHPFGTETLGRDVFSRTLFGARISLSVAFQILVLSVPLGIVAGAVAGYGGKRVERIIMGITDMFFAFPGLILAMAINAALGPSLENAAIAVAIVWWPSYARLTRGQVLAVKNNLYVDAARSVGVKNSAILFRHILPNCWSPLVVKLTADVGFTILTAASLSFVGLGVSPPIPEWGAMVADGRTYILDYWWYSTFPGLAIFVTVLAFALLGDSLQEVLDPMLRMR